MSDDLPAPGPNVDNGALAAPLSGAITLALSTEARPRFVP
jgi:hypothetical protein